MRVMISGSPVSTNRCKFKSRIASIVARCFSGVIPFGETVSNRLPIPTQVAVYTLATEPGQTISATVLNNNPDRQFIVPILKNAEGEEIPAKTQIFVGTNTVTSVYDLTGSAPYTFEFAVNGQYEITFDRGDATDADFTEVGPSN